MPTPPSHSRPLASLGVCSWSLQTSELNELITAIAHCGLSAVQLALTPFATRTLDAAHVRDLLNSAGIQIASAMMAMHAEDYTTLESIHATGGLRPDATWPINKSAAVKNAAIAADLGATLVTFHAGFLPEDPRSAPGATILERLRTIASTFAQRSIRVALETGQESAHTLSRYLHELRDFRVGVNFDPANMILYASGDPVAALRELLPFVAQVHIKDAIRTSTPGTWGQEVRVGDGEVDWPAFFAELSSAPRPVPAMIEREAGSSRLDDIRHAAAFVRRIIDIP